MYCSYSSPGAASHDLAEEREAEVRAACRAPARQSLVPRPRSANSLSRDRENSSVSQDVALYRRLKTRTQQPAKCTAVMRLLDAAAQDDRRARAHRIAQLHDRSGRERLRDHRADRDTAVGRRSCSPSTRSRSTERLLHTSSPFPMAAALTDGIRSPAWASRTRRTARRPAVRLRQRLQRRGDRRRSSVDVVVGDVEMSHPPDGRVHGGRDETTVPGRSIAPARSGPTSICVKFVSTCSRSTEPQLRQRAPRRGGDACMVVCDSVDVVVE